MYVCTCIKLGMIIIMLNVHRKRNPLWTEPGQYPAYYQTHVCCCPRSWYLQVDKIVMSEDTVDKLEAKGSSPGIESGSGSGSSPGGSAEQSPEPTGIKQTSDKELIPVPPPVPKNGVSILAHKLWIGNLDKRLTE